MRIDPIAASPRVHRHVFHSARSFADDGLLAFNPDRYAVPSSIAFIEGDGGEGGAGGGEGNAGGGAPKTFTKAEVDAQMAQARRSFEANAAKGIEAATATMRAELDALKAAHEDAGKSAAEKAQAQAARERAVIEARLAEKDKALGETAALVLQRTQELRDTRLDHELTSLMSTSKVVPSSMRFATLGFKADAKIEYDTDGAVAGVDLGGGRYPTVAAAHAEWMKTYGENFIAPPAGGAGTKPGNAGVGSKDFSNMTRSELAAEVDRTEPNTAHRR